MKQQVLLSLILAGSLVTTAAHAQEENQNANTSTVKVSDVQKSEEKVGGDLDEEITNAKMRAESGSKSLWSVSADLVYNGGSLEDPMGKVRPNYAGVASKDSSTVFAADVAVAYRLSKRDSVRLGTGVSILTPLHNSIEETTNQNSARKAYVSNPYASWSRSFRAMGLQQNVSASGSWETRPAYTEANYVASTSFGWTILGEIPNTNWQPGIAVTLDYGFFGDGPNSDDTLSNVEGGRTDYTLGVYPFVEYAFNDTYSFRTVFRPATFDHYRDDAADSFYHNMWTQSVGLGIAVARDFYLYPNFQFAPEYMKADTTNVGVNATINVF
ncbi:hypothetical protein AZI86_14070 [Bdellovibrio bacteriovorus]|uniref:Uncharacterized protein n=1 Tax=Bdellovibrio bacteriovorus TaxID=959 RepID=A0A150WJS1_BDEBC|nr:hypothetical protein [Bdellovibrio bacteriovorus]KYG63934.1 hypothetical protein AZI86_14070 [Bdellovibrio bacteriovorus]